MFYQQTFSKEIFEQSKKEYILIKGHMKMLSNINHKKSIVLINKDFLENFNQIDFKSPPPHCSQRTDNNISAFP